MFAVRRRLLWLTLLVLGLGCLPSAHHDAHADDPLYLDWPSLLPGLIDKYDPNSSNECVAGQLSCITAIVDELEQRIHPLAQECSHHAPYVLAYLRVTQTYRWSAEQPGYYADPQWMNHAVAVFAKYYFAAYDTWASDNSATTVPEAWRIALSAGKHREVTGSGDLIIGLNAHINRDLAFAMAAAGLVERDGKSAKPNYDKVNRVLNSVSTPLAAELAARFDPSMQGSDVPFALDAVATNNMIFAWREQAWRNAEALVAAPTEAARGPVADEIEANSVVQAHAYRTAFAYAPPLTTSASRDAWCAAHHADRAPLPYPFGTPE